MPMLSRAIVLVLVLLAPTGVSAAPASDLAGTIAASRSVLRIEQGRASGPAAQKLLAHARKAQFFMVGEEHGVATIAETVRALALLLRPEGYRHLALEADPWTTAILERELRAGGLPGLAGWLGRDAHGIAIPFYNWSAEAELAHAVVQGNEDALPALWGLDQVFIGAYGPLLEDIATRASQARAREQAATLAAQARGNMEFLGKLDEDALPRLRAALDARADRELLELLDAMQLSARIYAPFIDRAGLSVHAANLERENLMKRSFLARYRAAGAPKVLLKFGSNHVLRGLSPTHVPSLGNFVADLALHDGVDAFNLLVLCGPGTQAGDFQGGTGDCEIDVRSALPELAAQLDATQPTLVELAAWKDVPKQWQHLSAEMRELLWGYDALLIVPNGRPARALVPAG